MDLDKYIGKKVSVNENEMYELSVLDGCELETDSDDNTMEISVYMPSRELLISEEYDDGYFGEPDEEQDMPEDYCIEGSPVLFVKVENDIITNIEQKINSTNSWTYEDFEIDDLWNDEDNEIAEVFLDTITM